MTTNESRRLLAEDSLYDVIQSMLFVGSLVYLFAELRKRIREDDKEEDNDKEFRNVDLVFKDEVINVEKARRKREPLPIIDAKKLSQFIEQNKEPLKKDESSKLNEYALEELKKIPPDRAFLHNFDDHFAYKELVYGITMNRDQKRVTVVFRGSVGGRDWPTNFQAELETVKTPQNLLKMGFEEYKEVKIHKGFHNYLSTTKYDEIVGDLMAIYQTKARRYDLYVTGHSLGGALCSLLTFKLASEDRLKDYYNKKITCISFASPLVGNHAWVEAYTLLEQNDKIRHIRISNEQDIVPVAPPFPGYLHSGVNIHLKPHWVLNILTLNPFGNKSFLGQSRMGVLAAISLFALCWWFSPKGGILTFLLFLPFTVIILLFVMSIVMEKSFWIQALLLGQVLQLILLHVLLFDQMTWLVLVGYVVALAVFNASALSRHSLEDYFKRMGRIDGKLKETTVENYYQKHRKKIGET